MNREWNPIFNKNKKKKKERKVRDAGTEHRQETFIFFPDYFSEWVIFKDNLWLVLEGTRI